MDQTGVRDQPEYTGALLDSKRREFTPWYVQERRREDTRTHEHPQKGREPSNARLNEEEEEIMSIWSILFIVLLIAWIGGFTVFHVAGGLIHLLLVFAVISLILHFVMGTRTA